jgi:putative IMPACT (imprinted ancient) family translation regulator
MKKQLKVYYKYSNNKEVPMIRISNQLLRLNNFFVADTVTITYENNKITIEKILRKMQNEKEIIT